MTGRSLALLCFVLSPTAELARAIEDLNSSISKLDSAFEENTKQWQMLNEALSSLNRTLQQ